MAISKVKLPDNTTQDIKDSRITGVDSTPTANSQNVVTSGGVAEALATKQDNMVVLSYGTSTWNDFLDAYNKNAVVYCRASTNGNPASGVQGRMAFLAFLDLGGAGGSPIKAEFQYYRSVSSHSATQQGDQVFVYSLTSSGWTVTTREAVMWTQEGNGLQRSVSGNNLTYSVKTPSNSGLTVNSNGVAVTKPVPSTASTDNGKVLGVTDANGTLGWVAQQTVPTISTNVVSDKASDTKTSSPKSVYDEIHPAVVTTQPSGGFIPNVLYRLGTLTGSKTFTLASPSDNTIVNHYYWTFTAGSTAPTITWPSGISWFGGSAPTIAAGKHYDVSILDNIAVCMEV